MSGLGSYRKTVAAVIGSTLTWAGVAYVPDGHIGRPEWYALAVALATALGVYAVTNDRSQAPQPVSPTAPAVELTPAGSVPLLGRDARGRFIHAQPEAPTRFSGD